MCAIGRCMLIPFLAALALAVPAEAGTIVVELTFLPGKLAVTSAPATLSGTRAVPVTVADGRERRRVDARGPLLEACARDGHHRALRRRLDLHAAEGGGRRVRQRRPAPTA